MSSENDARRDRDLVSAARWIRETNATLLVTAAVFRRIGEGREQLLPSDAIKLSEKLRTVQQQGHELLTLIALGGDDDEDVSVH